MGVCMPYVNRMTDACENITLPQTSFARGKDVYAITRLHTKKSIKALTLTPTVMPTISTTTQDDDTHNRKFMIA